MNDIHNLPDVHHTSSSTFLSAARTQKVNDQITVEKPSTKKKKLIHWPDGAHCDALGYLLQSWGTVFQKYLLSMELGNSIHSFPLI